MKVRFSRRATMLLAGLSACFAGLAAAYNPPEGTAGSSGCQAHELTVSGLAETLLLPRSMMKIHQGKDEIVFRYVHKGPELTFADVKYPNFAIRLASHLGKFDALVDQLDSLSYLQKQYKTETMADVWKSYDLGKQQITSACSPFGAGSCPYVMTAYDIIHAPGYSPLRLLVVLTDSFTKPQTSVDEIPPSYMSRDEYIVGQLILSSSPLQFEMLRDVWSNGSISKQDRIRIFKHLAASIGSCNGIEDTSVEYEPPSSF